METYNAKSFLLVDTPVSNPIFKNVLNDADASVISGAITLLEKENPQGSKTKMAKLKSQLAKLNNNEL